MRTLYIIGGILISIIGPSISFYAIKTYELQKELCPQWLLVFVIIAGISMLPLGALVSFKK